MDIKGLRYIENYISKKQEQWLLDKIDNQSWLSDIKRRVQHYGYKYDYRSKKVTNNMYLGPIPKWLNMVSGKLLVDDLVLSYPDQIIINEYLPGQGISKHVDCEPCFTSKILSLSLGSGCIMRFTKCSNTSTKKEIYLNPCSLLIITDEARYNWYHEIPARKTDNKIIRQRRVSVTFRKVILERK